MRTRFKVKIVTLEDLTFSTLRTGLYWARVSLFERSSTNSRNLYFVLSLFSQIVGLLTASRGGVVKVEIQFDHDHNMLYSMAGDV